MADVENIKQPRWMNLPRFFIVGLVLLILAGGTWVRLRQPAADPLDVSHSGQLFFLLTARSFSPSSTQIAAGLPTSADYGSATRDVPLLQWVDAGLSNAFNLDLIVTARVSSILGWMLSSLLLYLMLRRITRPIAALAVLGLAVFMPFSIQFSRVVLPGSWALFFVLLSLWMLWRWMQMHRWSPAVLSGVFGMAAVLLDVEMLYILLGGVIAAWFILKKSRQGGTTVQWLAIVSLLLLPRLIYSIVLHPNSLGMLNWLGINEFGFGLAQIKQLVRLELRLESIIGVLGIGFAFLGVLLWEKGAKRSLLIGLWAGFAVMALVFLNAITESIYVLYPVIFLAVVSLVPVFEILLDRMSENSLPAASLMLLLGILVVGAGLGSIDGRRLVKANPEQIPVEFWRSLGEKLGSDAVFVSNTPKVTLPLAYYGNVQPVCIATDASCLSSLDERIIKMEATPLYFIAFTGDLAEGSDLSLRLQDHSLRCDAGSGVTIIPLTSTHPACTDSGG